MEQAKVREAKSLETVGLVGAGDDEEGLASNDFFPFVLGIVEVSGGQVREVGGSSSVICGPGGRVRLMAGSDAEAAVRMEERAGWGGFKVELDA